MAPLVRSIWVAVNEQKSPLFLALLRKWRTNNVVDSDLTFIVYKGEAMLPVRVVDGGWVERGHFDLQVGLYNGPGE